MSKEAAVALTKSMKVTTEALFSGKVVESETSARSIFVNYDAL